MKLTRIGEKKCLSMLKDGYKIVSHDWYTGLGLYVEDNKYNRYGYITYDLLFKLIQNKIVVMSKRNYSSEEYTLA